MSDSTIKAEGIGKSYLIGHRSNERYVALRDVITDKMKRLWSKIRNYQSYAHVNIEEFWALKDVSFEVKQGERIGIIGRNGAGKSTLLKILSRITEPTTGRISIKGRVASLLEVGTGFHPELTGQENIYLNGAILGMTRNEIKAKFDEIVDFADVEKFLDTPVKRFSSGMYMRLAFAVAAHLEPEILVVDEVLAVGDEQFQKKCLGKMKDVGKDGRTVLFVSHNMAAINALCDKALLLDKGKMVCEGKTQDVIDSYLIKNRNETLGCGRIDHKDDLLSPIQIEYLAIKNEKGEVSREIKYQETFFLELGIRLRKKASYYYTALSLFDAYGNLVIFTADDDISESQLIDKETGRYTYKIRYHSKLLKPGEYFVEAHLCKQPEGKIDNYITRLSFEIQDRSSRRGMRGLYRSAITAPEIHWELKNADK